MYKIILALRYLFKKRISYLALSAVTLCVFIVVVVMTVMTGLVNNFKQENHQFVGDCVLTSPSLVGFPYYQQFLEILDNAPFVHAASPVIKNYALVTPRGSKRSRGVQIMGIDPARHSKVTAFAQSLHYNRSNPENVFTSANDHNKPGCVVGIDLWLSRGPQGTYNFSPTPDIASLIISAFPLTAKGALATAGASEVNTKTFEFTDISRTGIAKVDGTYIYIPFEQAQLLCMSAQQKRTNAIHIKFTSDTTPEQGNAKIASLWRDFLDKKTDDPYAYLLKNVSAQTWKQNRRSYIAAMEKEKTMMSVLFSLVALTTVFIVFVVFYMIIAHKSKDIGILKSIGAPALAIINIFFLFAFMIAAIGSTLGIALGIIFLGKMNQVENWLFEHFGFQIWDRSIFAIEDIPNQIDITLLAFIAAFAILACLAGAFIPTIQAVRLKPAQILQVNQV